MSGVVTLARHDVDWLLRGVLAAVSKDDVTPILCAVKWTIEGGRVTVVGTDRYRVHQLYVPAPAGTPDGTFLMSRFQAETLLKLRHSAARRLAGEQVRLTWTDPVPLSLPALPINGKIHAKHYGSILAELLNSPDDDNEVLAYSALQVRGNFPPVDSLFDSARPEGEEPAPVALFNPELIAATRHLRVGQGEPLAFHTARLADAAAPAHAKLRPLLVMNYQGTARALIQSNVGLSEQKEWGA